VPLHLDFPQLKSVADWTLNCDSLRLIKKLASGPDSPAGTDAVTTRFTLRCAISILSLTVAVPTYTAPGSASHDRVSEEEYAVFDAVIERLYIQRRSASLIVISKETEAGAQPQPGKGPIIGVAGPEEMESAMKLITELTPAYQAINREPAKLKDLFDLSVDYVLVSKKKALGRLAKDHEQTTQFSKAYPGSEAVGLVGLSRAGFNADHTLALMYAVHWCGAGCGDGMFVVLGKENNQWNVRYQAIASVAGSGT